MAQYVKKQVIVEARQYELDPAMIVVSDAYGEQTAHKGDWLVGSERGKVQVVTAEKFALEYAPYSATAEDETLATAETTVTNLQSQVNTLETENTSLKTALGEAQSQNAALQQGDSDTAAAQSHVATLQTALDASKAETAAVQAKLDQLVELEKEQASAKAAEVKAQNEVKSTLSS